MNRTALPRRQEQVDPSALVLDEPVLAVPNELFDLDLLGVGDPLVVSIDDRKFDALVGVENLGVDHRAGKEDLFRRVHDAIGAVFGDGEDMFEL